MQFAQACVQGVCMKLCVHLHVCARDYMEVGVHESVHVCVCKGLFAPGQERVQVATWCWGTSRCQHSCWHSGWDVLCVALEGSVSSAETSPKALPAQTAGLTAPAL